MKLFPNFCPCRYWTHDISESDRRAAPRGLADPRTADRRRPGVAADRVDDPGHAGAVAAWRDHRSGLADLQRLRQFPRGRDAGAGGLAEAGVRPSRAFPGRTALHRGGRAVPVLLLPAGVLADLHAAGAAAVLPRLLCVRV